jgi:hypothetical protein
MELKHIVGLIVLCTVLFLLFTAGGENDYKKSSSWFKNCIPIPFIGQKICLQPHEGKKRGPKSKGGTTTNSGRTNSGTTNSGTTNSGTTNSGTTNSGTTNSGTTNSGTTNTQVRSSFTQFNLQDKIKDFTKQLKKKQFDSGSGGRGSGSGGRGSGGRGSGSGGRGSGSGGRGSGSGGRGSGSGGRGSGGRGSGSGGRGSGSDRKICIHHDQVLDLTGKMIRITNNTREQDKYLFSKYNDINFNEQWISNITESTNQLYGIVNNRRNVERRAGKYFVCFSYESLRNLWSQIDETLEKIEYYIEERKQNGAPSTMTDKKNQKRFELFFRDVMLLIGYNNNIVRILNNADEYNLPTKQST